MEILFKFVFWLLIVSVEAQESIVNQLQYTSGETFNITCDISKFTGLKTINYFKSMTLWRQVSPQTSFESIASYEPIHEVKMTTNLPHQWHVSYAGGEGFLNKNTIRVVVTVVNYQCTDAGLYYCHVEIPNPQRTVKTTPVNLTAKARITQNNIIMTPQKQEKRTDEYSSVNNVGEEITMTCSFTGPENLQAVWKRQTSNAEVNYPYPNNIKNSNPVSSVVSGCNTFTYSSELKFTLEESDNGNTYICVVMEDKNERSRKMFTIGVSTTIDSTGKPRPQTDSTGSNVGAIVVGGLVVLVILVVLIYFLVIQKKKQNESSEDTGNNVY